MLTRVAPSRINRLLPPCHSLLNAVRDASVVLLPTPRLATSGASRACSYRAWRDIDAPWVNRDHSRADRTLYVNWFPMEKANEHWTKDLQDYATGLYQSVLNSTMKHELPCFQTSTGTFEANGREDAYFVLKQILHSQNTIALAQSWQLRPREIRIAARFTLRARNASAHSVRDELWNKSQGRTIHNKRTIGDVYKSLRLLLQAAATHGERHGDDDGRGQAQTSLSWLESRYSLYRARENAFRERVSEKVEAIRRGELEVHLAHEQPHRRLRWQQLCPEVQKLIVDQSISRRSTVSV